MEKKFRDTFNQLIDENENELKSLREDDKRYNEVYQNKIIKPLMQLFYKEPYTYMPLVGFTRKIFEEIEYRKFQTYHSSNLILGTMKQDYEFKMANVVAINSKYRHFTNSTINRFNDYTVFNGVLVEIEVKEAFNHYLYLKSKRDILSKDLNEMRRELKLSKNKLKRENIEEYNVYTSNEEFAEKILSKVIVSKLLEYSNMETGEYCEMAIRENFIYLMIPNIEILGTRVTLYEDRENMYQELWEEYKKFSFAFELSHFMIDRIVSQK